MTMNTTSSMTKKAVIGTAVSIFFILLDQLTKVLALQFLKDQEPLVLIPGVFELRYLENRGAAFGILQGKKTFFVVFTLIILAVLVYLFLKKIPMQKRFFFMNAICVLFFAGAIGNFIDRVMRNYVVDFFYFSLVDFPIFNVADIYVTVAAFAMILFGLFYYKEEDFNQIFPSKKPVEK